MSRKNNSGTTIADLRMLAEQLVKEVAPRLPECSEPLSLEQTLLTIHELRVHQIELEMQNDQLRRTQLDLEAARARYFNLYDLAPVGYCTIGESGLIQEANLTASLMLGVARSSLVGMPLTRHILSQEQDVYYLLLIKLKQTGHPQSCELRVVNRDGKALWVRLAATISHADGAGRVIRLVLSDITSRKQTEEALARSRDEMRAICDHAPVMMCVLDVNCRVVYANPAFLSFTGASEAVLRGGSVCTAVGCIEAMDDPRGCGFGRNCSACPLTVVLKDTIATGVGLNDVEFSTSILRDGFLRQFTSIASTVFVPAEAGNYLLLSLLDITARKHAETALRRSQERHFTILQTAMDGMWLAAQDGRLLDVNRALCQMTGYSEQELLAKRIPDLEAAETHEDTAAHIRKIVALGGDRFESRLRRKDGSIFDVEVSVQYLSAEGGQLVAFLRDITSRKQVEVELRRSEAKFRALYDSTTAAVNLPGK